MARSKLLHMFYVGAAETEGIIEKVGDLCSKVVQVGFFKKNPMKRSAAVYLLCVCLSFPVSRK